jgi:hypothetical protein
VLFVYTGAAVTGLVLLAASLLGAGHGHDAGHATSGDHESPPLVLLSARVWTYLLAFGGATGLLLRFVAPVDEPLRALLAVGVGTAAAALARSLITRASRSGPSGTVQRADLVGRAAGVLVPFDRATTGKIRIRAAGSHIDLLATTDDPEPLRGGEEVLILELREDGAAVVTRAPT